MSSGPILQHKSVTVQSMTVLGSDDAAIEALRALYTGLAKNFKEEGMLTQNSVPIIKAFNARVANNQLKICGKLFTDKEGKTGTAVLCLPGHEIDESVLREMSASGGLGVNSSWPLLYQNLMSKHPVPEIDREVKPVKQNPLAAWHSVVVQVPERMPCPEILPRSGANVVTLMQLDLSMWGVKEPITALWASLEPATANALGLTAPGFYFQNVVFEGTKMSAPEVEYLDEKSRHTPEQQAVLSAQKLLLELKDQLQDRILAGALKSDEVLRPLIHILEASDFTDPDVLAEVAWGIINDSLSKYVVAAKEVSPKFSETLGKIKGPTVYFLEAVLHNAQHALNITHDCRQEPGMHAVQETKAESPKAEDSETTGITAPATTATLKNGDFTVSGILLVVERNWPTVGQELKDIAKGGASTKLDQLFDKGPFNFYYVPDVGPWYTPNQIDNAAYHWRIECEGKNVTLKVPENVPNGWLMLRCQDSKGNNFYIFDKQNSRPEIHTSAPSGVNRPQYQRQVVPGAALKPTPK